jgi:hypothetical protein
VGGGGRARGGWDRPGPGRGLRGCCAPLSGGVVGGGCGGEFGDLNQRRQRVGPGNLLITTSQDAIELKTIGGGLLKEFHC